MSIQFFQTWEAAEKKKPEAVYDARTGTKKTKRHKRSPVFSYYLVTDDRTVTTDDDIELKAYARFEHRHDAEGWLEAKGHDPDWITTDELDNFTIAWVPV